MRKLPKLQVLYAFRTLQDVFKRALALEAGFHLAEGVHLGRSPHVMQVFISAACHHDVLTAVHTRSMLERVMHRANACWKC